MGMRMPQEQMPEQAPQEGQGEGSLVSKIYTDLMSMAELIGQSEAVPQPKKEEFYVIVKAYEQFVQSLGEVGQQTGAGPAQPRQGGMGAVPMEAGAAKVRPAY